MPSTPPPGPNDKYTSPGTTSTDDSTPKPIGTPYGLQQKWDPTDAWINQGNASLAAATGQPANAFPVDVVPARYYQGAQWTELPTNASDLEYLQNSLIQTGLLDAAGIVRGQPDTKTANAMEELLAISNQQGLEWRKALELRLKAVAANPLPAKVVPPLVVHLTNPDDLKKTLQNVAQTLYGGNLSPEDEMRFVATYQAQEAAAAQAQYAQQYNPSSASGYGAGGTVTAPPDKAVAAEKMIREQHPTEVKTQGFIDAFEPLRQALTQRVQGGGVT